MTRSTPQAPGRVLNRCHHKMFALCRLGRTLHRCSTMQHGYLLAELSRAMTVVVDGLAGYSCHLRVFTVLSSLTGFHSNGIAKERLILLSPELLLQWCGVQVVFVSGSHIFNVGWFHVRIVSNRGWFNIPHSMHQLLNTFILK